MGQPKLRLPKSVEQALTDTGLPWQIKPGKRHWKIFVDGRMASILPHGSGDGGPRGFRNIISHIRRAGRDERDH